MKYLHILGWLWASPALAVEQTTVLSPTTVQSIGLLKTALALLLVIGIFFISIWLLRKLSCLQPQSGRVMRVLGGVSVGAKERLLLIEIGEEQIVVGVAPGRVEKIHVMTQPIAAPSNEAMELPSFVQHLQRAMRKKGDANAS